MTNTKASWKRHPWGYELQVDGWTYTVQNRAGDFPGVNGWIWTAMTPEHSTVGGDIFPTKREAVQAVLHFHNHKYLHPTFGWCAEP